MRAVLLCLLLAGCAPLYVNADGKEAPEVTRKECASFAWNGPHMGWVNGNPLVVLQHGRVTKAMAECMEAKGFRAQ